MDVYKTLKFGNEAQTMFYFALGIFGVQIMQHAFNCATMSTAGASPKAAGVACLANAAMWFLFAFIDGIRIPLGTLPPFMPKESIMANMVIQSPSAHPRRRLDVAGKPSPRASRRLPGDAGHDDGQPRVLRDRVRRVHASFLDMFVPASWPIQARRAPPNSSSSCRRHDARQHLPTMMISNAEPGTPDTNYRLLRANLYAMFFYMGKFTEAVVACTLAPAMRVSSFVSCFAVLFFAATKFGEYPITVAKTADAKATKKTK